MAVEMSIKFPDKDLRHLQAQMDRFQKEMGKSGRETVKWAGKKIAGSLAASTKVSPKLRKIVENPDKQFRTDARIARWGVMAYRKGVQVFRPIRGTGEYGKIRYVDKKTAFVMERDRATGKTRRVNLSTGTGEFDVPGLMQHKKRKIGRSGLAKKAWQYAAANIGRTSSAVILGVSNAVSVAWSGVKENPRITITNGLGYAMKAFRTSGEKEVNTAILRAADGMARQIEDKVFAKAKL